MRKSLFMSLVVALVLTACGGAEERKRDHLQRGQEHLQKNEFEKAQIEFKNVLQIDPKSAEAWYYQGSTLEKQQKFREALASFNEAMQLDPAYLAAKTGAARIYLFVGATSNSLELVQEVLTRTPDDADALVVYAGALNRSGQAEQALLEVRKALAKDPDHLASLALLTRIYLDMQQVDQAEALLLAALQRKSSDELHSLLIKLYSDVKKLELAVPHLQQLIKSHPENMDYRNRLAVAFEATGKTIQAEEVLKAAVTDLPENIAAKVSLIQFLAQRRDIMFAHVELEKFIQEDDDNTDLKLLSAQLYLQNQDAASAEKIWRQMLVDYANELPAAQARMELIRLLLRDEKRMADVKSELAILMKDNPTFIDGLVLRGRMALDDARYEDAINDFRAVLKDQPNAIPILKMLASAFLLTERPELAEEQLKIALSETPRDAALHLQLAQAFQAQKRIKDATQHLQLAQHLDPGSAAASEILFKNYLAQKYYAAADKLAASTIKAQPESALGYFMHGMLLQAQGKDAESMAHLERALSKNPQATEPLNLLTRAAIITGKQAYISQKLQAIVKEFPNHLVAKNLLGELLLQQKQVAQAQSIFSDITQQKPAWWIGWRNLALTELALKHTDKALDVYRLGIQASQDERLVIALALLHEQLQQIDAAVMVYEAALKRKPDSQSFANNLALLLVEKRSDKVSRDRALQLVKAFETSKDPNSLDTLGWVRYQRGELDLAIAALKQSDALAPGNGLIEYHLAASYFGKGDRDQARRYLQAAIQSQPALEKRAEVVKLKQDLQAAG